jgi:hypothetical protein
LQPFDAVLMIGVGCPPGGVIVDMAGANQQDRCPETRAVPDAATVNRLATTTQARLRVVASISAPAGAVAISPAIPPIAETVPIAPVAQPRLCNSTPKKGPMPACTSAMKKLTA